MFTTNEPKFIEHSSSGVAEPMALGSPVSSPKLKAVNQNYLPPYLFGESATSPVGPSTWNASMQQNISFPPSPCQLTPVSLMRDQHQISYQSPVPSSVMSTPNTAKSGGPPVQGLLYSNTSPVSSFTISQLDATPKISDKQATERSFSNILTPSKTFSVNNSFMSPAQIDPFFTQGEALKDGEQLDESWVTVFGFPPASASYILQQFSQYGNIVDHKVTPNGNWMHIKYQSKLQAKKALSKNGKIFSGNIMIGVKPCIEMDLMESAKENSMQETSTVQIADGSKSSVVEPSKPSLKNIRPLTQAYQSPNTQTQAMQQKSGSLVSKALEYIWKL